MIFVTTGSQKFPFGRLLIGVDRLAKAGVITEEVFMQTGASDYVPRYCSWQPFLNRDAFAEKIQNCDILITHGGAGIMREAVRRGKRTIAIPRLARYGEHVDDHQLELTAQFQKMNLLFTCMDLEQLPELLRNVRSHTFSPYSSNTGAFVAALSGDIRALLRNGTHGTGGDA